MKNDPFESGLRIFVPYGRQAGSTRVRVHTWLERTGIAHSLESYADTRNHNPFELARKAPQVLAAETRVRRESHLRHDRVLVHREASPFSAGKIESRLARNSNRFIYDLDDAIAATPKTGAQRYRSKAVTCVSATEAADLVLAGSKHLAEWASQHSRNVVYLPSCIEPHAYTVKASYEVVGPPRLVWLGSPTVERNLHLAADALLKLHRETGARLTIISTGNQTLGELDSLIDRVEWYEGVEATLSQYDVGLAPLIDGPVQRGKCAYKILQYAAAGLPVVGSPVGANDYVLRDLDLAAAVTPQDWQDALFDILDSSATARDTIGTHARKAVGEMYSYEEWESVWLNAVS